MKNVSSADFARIVTAFLTDYLPLQRCYSKNTILSYRDTLKLFLRFISEEKGMKLNSFRVSDFTRETVIEFLEWYRQKGAKSSAANQCLAAIKTLADYAQPECIDYISPLQEIAAIKAKKSTAREIEFLTVEQVSLLINRPNVNTSSGLRHRAVLTLLYDSGCRVQELCDLTVADISLSGRPTIRLHGKGDKYRTIPISEATASIVEGYISRQLSGALKDRPLIQNRYHNKITVTVSHPSIFTSSQGIAPFIVCIATYRFTIAKEHLPYIFDRFYKAGNPSGDSVGIGLAMSRQMILMQNGTISVSSEEGVGTEFHIKMYSEVVI